MLYRSVRVYGQRTCEVWLMLFVAYFQSGNSTQSREVRVHTRSRICSSLGVGRSW